MMWSSVYRYMWLLRLPTELVANYNNQTNPGRHGYRTFVSSAYDIQKYGGYPAKIGYAIRDMASMMDSVESPHSGKWSMAVDDAGTLNAYRADGRTLQTQLHQREGMAVYRLDGNSDSYINPREACFVWHQVTAC